MYCYEIKKFSNSIFIFSLIFISKKKSAITASNIISNVLLRELFTFQREREIARCRDIKYKQRWIDRQRGRREREREKKEIDRERERYRQTEGKKSRNDKNSRILDQKTYQIRLSLLKYFVRFFSGK